ncbi:hypothetical protein H0266_02135 [Halobacillus locisalis]|uniref:Uncharacterized protein n=1 Tax=Halobacillus locisalis TaxID=220753 RepID=A0A838CPA4_9BACI|nr:hypothetical protein [Halobacillus locisalis]MBA2173688.1 hypothetical protein [Halobacillus locisalis]
MKRITLFLFILILIGCQQELTLPPQPHITVEGESVTYIQGNFSWDGDGRMSPDPFEKAGELEPISVEPHSKLSIVFEDAPKHIQAGIYDIIH